jgi:hypothetical protein
VIRYVETCSLTKCRALALAVSFGNDTPAKGPVSRIVYEGIGSKSELGISKSDPSSETDRGAVPGESESRSGALPFLLLSSFGGFLVAGPDTSGKSLASMRVMAARWDPASTAKTEFFAHFAAVDRTRKPVTLSSLGPPPEPCESQ